MAPSYEYCFRSVTSLHIHSGNMSTRFMGPLLHFYVFRPHEGPVQCILNESHAVINVIDLLSMYWLRDTLRGGGVHPDNFVKLDFEIAVDQQTRARDQTFEGVPDCG